MKRVKLIPINPAKMTETPSRTEKTSEEDKIDKMVSMFIYPSFDEASSAIFKLLSISYLRTPTVNDLFSKIGLSQTEYGNDYGWPDIYLTLLKCGYGIVENPKYPRECYYIRFPKVSKLMPIQEREL